MRIIIATTCLAALIQLTSYSYASTVTVAIGKFENEANAPESLFRSLRSRITDNIINVRKFDVVERQRLESVFSESRLSDGGLTSDSSSVMPEKLTEAEYVLYGSILSLGIDKSSVGVAGVAASKDMARVELQLRIAKAGSGKLLASKIIVASKSQTRVAGDGVSHSGTSEEQAIDDAIREAAKKVTEALIELVYPSKVLKVDKSEILVNLVAEQTEAGALYEVFSTGEDLIDPDTQQSLGVTEEFVGRIVIYRLMPKYSVAKPTVESDINAFSPGMVIRRLDEVATNEEQKKVKENLRRNFESRF